MNLIVACDENRVIGRKGRLPWRIREDWRWFMGLTRGGACVIGRVSFEAMLKGGHVTEKRRFFVVSSHAELAGPFSEVFPDTASALAAAKKSGLPVWICGGSRIYEETFPIADRLYLTRVHLKVEGGDAWLPDWTGWFRSETFFRQDGSDENCAYTFEVYERV